jgi:hypothetical protein
MNRGALYADVEGGGRVPAARALTPLRHRNLLKISPPPPSVPLATAREPAAASAPPVASEFTGKWASQFMSSQSSFEASQR